MTVKRLRHVIFQDAPGVWHARLFFKLLQPQTLCSTSPLLLTLPRSISLLKLRQQYLT